MDLFKKDLRSVLIADKQGIPIQRLNHEYRDLTGENIEWDRNKYATLKDFLLTIPDACTISENGYDTLVLPVVTEKQAVIKELVEGQRSKQFNRKPPFRFGSRKYAGRRIIDKYQKQRFHNRLLVPRFKSIRTRSPPKRFFNDTSRRFNNSPDRSSVNRRVSSLRRSPDRSIDRFGRERRSNEDYHRLSNRRRSLSRSPPLDRRRRERHDSPVRRRRSSPPNRFYIDRSSSSRSNSRKRYDSPDRSSRRRSESVRSRSKSKSPIRSTRSRSNASNNKTNYVENKLGNQSMTTKNQSITSKNQSMTMKDQSITSKNQSIKTKDQNISAKNQIVTTKNPYVNMIKDYLTKESPMIRTPTMDCVRNDNSNSRTVNYNNLIECNGRESFDFSNNSLEKQGNNSTEFNNNRSSIENNQLIKNNALTKIQNPVTPSPVSRDPRTRKRSQSVSIDLNRSNSSINSVMSKPFDVRFTQNIMIPVKVFTNHHNVVSSSPKTTTSNSTTPEIRSRKDLFDKNEQNETENGDRIENENLIERIRDYSPDYRNKKENANSSDINSNNNSLALIDNNDEDSSRPQTAKRSKMQIYDIDNDYSDYILNGPLINYQSLRSFSKKSKCKSVIESSNISEDDSITWLDDNFNPDENSMNENSTNENSMNENSMNDVFDLLNLSNVKINYSSNETETAVKLTKSTVYKVIVAIPKSINEFAPADSVSNGYFVPNIINPQRESVNYVHELDFKDVNSKINYKIELKRFAKENNLPEPIFNQTVYMNRDNTIGGYSSKLEIGNKAWFTVLNTHQTPDDADNNVAKKALEELKIDSIKLEKDDCLIPEIIKLFKNKKESLCNSVLEKRYTDLYEKTIEPDWLDMIRSSSSFSVKERLIDDSTLIYTVELAPSQI